MAKKRKIRMKKLLLLIGFLVEFESFGCCPWWHKAKALLNKPASYDPEHAIDLGPVRPEMSAEVVAAAAGTGLEQYRTFEFTFKTGSGPEETKSVVLYPIITRREFKERIVKACGHEDYKNHGYIVTIRDETLGSEQITKSDDRLIGSAVLDKISKYKNPSVTLYLI